MPATGIYIPQSTLQSLFITITVPQSATPGTYTSTATVVFGQKTPLQVPITMTVWNISLPTLRQSTIGALWSGMWNPSYFQPYYGGSWNRTAYYDMMIDHRVPPDSLYLSGPRPIEDYQYLADHGVSWFGLMDVCSLPQPVTDSSANNTSNLNYTLPGYKHKGADCPQYSPAYVKQLITTLTPIVAQLQERNILQYAYVYGFDENPVSCEPQVRQLFGAIKASFPALRTVATLNWSPMPLDLPVDVWVLQYEGLSKRKCISSHTYLHCRHGYVILTPQNLTRRMHGPGQPQASSSSGTTALR